ncbi:MAG: hypothetical protein OXC82_08760 [Rhodobacteraceae bacterium]|nr:hypothetical protein [Paracoccaceae bacterium]
MKKRFVFLPIRQFGETLAMVIFIRPPLKRQDNHSKSFPCAVTGARRLTGMKTTMTTAEFDRRFDEGQDLGNAID